MEDGSFGMCDTFGKKEVDKKDQKLSQGKTALRKHRLEGDRILRVVQVVPMEHGTAGAVAQAVTNSDAESACFVVREQSTEEQKLLGMSLKTISSRSMELLT